MKVAAFQTPCFGSLHLFARAAEADLVLLCNSCQMVDKNKGIDGATKYTGQKHIHVAGTQPAAWLPIATGARMQPINQTPLAVVDQKLIRSMRARYTRARNGIRMLRTFEHLLNTSTTLGSLNVRSFNWGMMELGIYTPIRMDTELDSTLGTVDQSTITLQQMLELGATEYLVGEHGASILDREMWEDNGVDIVIQNWTPPAYKQGKGVFVQNLSVLDAVAHLGPNFQNRAI